MQGYRGVGATLRCLSGYTYTPPAQGRGRGGQTQMPNRLLHAKTHAFLRVLDCNSVLVCDQRGRRRVEKRGAALPLSLVKAAHSAYGFIIYRQGNHIAMWYDCLHLFTIDLHFCYWLHRLDVPIHCSSTAKREWQWLLIYHSRYHSTLSRSYG